MPGIGGPGKRARIPGLVRAFHRIAKENARDVSEGGTGVMCEPRFLVRCSALVFGSHLVTSRELTRGGPIVAAK